MIQFNNVSKSFGHQQVIIDASFAIHPGERVGIVGPNGAGKSTLCEMLSGNLTPDKGDCSFPSSQRLGYVHQQLHPGSVHATLLEYVENALPEVHTIMAQLQDVEHQLQTASGDEQERLLKRLGNLQTELEHLGAYELKNRAETILTGLGFDTRRFDEPFSAFSGGWQIRAELARILVARPDILLLDEPTNYLDVPAVEWLRDFLRTYPGTMLLISHDRYLLNSLTNVTLEVMGGHVTRYQGNYARYVHDREARHEQLLAQKRNLDHRKEQLERFIDRFKYKATKAAQAQSRQKMLDKLEEVEVHSIAVRGPKIRLPEPPRSGQLVVSADDVHFSYDGKTEVVNGATFSIERGDHAAFVGLNGMGKTTLLRLLAGKLTPTSGKITRGVGVEMGYQSQDYADTLAPDKTIFETAKENAVNRSEADIRNLLAGFGFYGEALDKTVRVLSGGEKVRLGLARLLLRPLNFLLLDEPTTHLDIFAREALQDALKEYKGSLCLVSHDIEFVRAVSTTIFALTPGKITRYYGDYDYYREKLAQEQQQLQADQPTDNGQKRRLEGSMTARQTTANAPQAAKNVKNAPVPAPGENSFATRRQRRREEAEIRNEIAKLKKPHEAIVAETEAHIAELEAEQKSLYDTLAAAAPGTDFATVNKRLAEIGRLLDDEAWRWEAASTEIEKLVKECEIRLAELRSGE